MLPYFKIFNSIVYTYPLIMGLAWGVAFNFFKFLQNRYRPDFKHSNLYFWSVFLMSWIGAKVFFLITSTSVESTKYALSANFWLGGGFVFYGGLIFGLIFTLVFLKLTKQKLNILSVVVPPLAMGHAMGRIGCFFAGCCYGKVWEVGGLDRYPVQLIEALALILISFISMERIKKNKSTFEFYIITYSVLRFFLEFIRGDYIRGIWFMGLSTSQIVALVLILISLIALLVTYLKRPTAS